jgi:AAA ATPase domain
MTPETLCGRDSEIALLDEWLRDIRDSGRALLIHGEAGIGKTSILGAGASAARSRGCRVLTVTGVESEAHLAFAGLHQLLRPVLGQVDELPPPQRKALLTAFGVLDGEAPAIFLVGLATLNLLADIAAEKPLLLVADDVQWLDTPTAEVLAFVGRRLGSDRILLLAAMRDGFQSPLVAARLPELVIEPLSEAPSAELLDAHAPDLTGVARNRILDQAAGNPLALVELPRALRSERLSSGPGLPAILPMTDRLEHAFAARASALPPATAAALLVAAVDDSPSAPEVLGEAAHLTGAPAGIDILEPAVQAGLITIVEGTIRFRHPLVRSALEQAAPVSRRNEAHAALAQVLASDPDRRAWHRAASIMGTDEGAAAELEAAARRAQDRGATVIAMAAEERAAALTEDHALRVGRLLAAAEMGFELGQPTAVRRLLDEAALSGPAQLDRARMTWLREIFNDGEPGNPMEVRRLVAASDEAVAAGEVSLALNLLRGAALRCWWADPGAAARDLVIASVDRVADARSEPRALEIMSLAAPVDRGAFVARAVALAAPLAVHDAAVSAMLGVTAHAVGDYARAVDLLGEAAHGLREQGRLGLLAQALIVRGWGCIHVGKLGEAARDLDEGWRLAIETEQPIRANGARIGQALLAGLRGEEDVAEAIAFEAEAVILPIRLGDLLAVLQLARGLTALSAGRHGDAFDHIGRVFDRVDPAFNELESYAAVGYLGVY